MTAAGFVVLLHSSAQERTLPIVIGSGEAQAILLELKGMEFPRPLTHDLFRNVLAELGVTLVKVEVTELREETFFAMLHLDGPAGRITVDARPSDALALALRCGAAIHVAEAVMAKAGVALDKDGEPEVTALAAPQADSVSDLKAKLAQAIAAERYEEAARLRDKLREL
jgi:bifunctional DNase/RNase